MSGPAANPSNASVSAPLRGSVAAPLRASIDATPSTVTVGDPVSIHLVLEAPPRSTVTLTNPPSSPRFIRLAASPWTFRRAGASWRIERTESWAAFSPGTTTKLSYGYAVHAPGTPATPGTLVSPPIAVASVLPAGTAVPPAAPLRPPVARPFVPWQLAAALLLAAAVAFLFGSLLVRRRRSAIARSADEIFEQELDLLEASLSKGAPEETFYDWLADISRWYVEQKLAVPAPHLTSAEIVATLQREASGSVADAFERVLAVCDGYRFARRETRREQAVSAIAAAREGAAVLREEEEPEAARETA